MGCNNAARPIPGLFATTATTRKLVMHTDEYEISIAREINHCRQVVGKITEALQQRRQQYQMELDEARVARTDGRLQIKDKELGLWQEDLEALPQWEQRLKEYEEALATMRISASSF
ncbi:MAG: hypothetical protein BWK76_10825 [Desulfobulbaceae bacterium A2]|nr:MAG: hypothetical protein BWK76_10825 [Desulfobulbaceae bacterium A2]